MQGSSQLLSALGFSGCGRERCSIPMFSPGILSLSSQPAGHPNGIRWCLGAGGTSLALPVTVPTPLP